MKELKKNQKNKLKAVMTELKRQQKQLQQIHRQTGYEDLEHGVLALEIAEHTVEETLEHTGLGGEIPHKPEASAYRKAKEWHKAIKNLRAQGNKFLESHDNEDLETALKALEIAEGSLKEVMDHYE